MEGEPIDRTDALVALFGDLHFLHLLGALDQPYANQIGQHVDLMPLEAEHQAVFVGNQPDDDLVGGGRSEEHTSELQSLMRISYAVFCFNKNQPIYSSSSF